MLDDIAIRHGTDKSSEGHGYTQWYEQYLEPMRGDPITLLELGVWAGASLRTWREYLPQATIVGVDKVDREIHIDGVDIYIFDQNDREDIEFCLALYGGFDVIIDDASHLSSKTIRSFKLLYPHLNPGGLYVIEDLQTSYDIDHYGRFEADQSPQGRTLGGEMTAMAFCKRLADELNRREFPKKYALEYDLKGVSFRRNICFIEKQDLLY